jgi:hypothetical protein
VCERGRNTDELHRSASSDSKPSNIYSTSSVRTWRNLQLVPILSFWYPVRSEKAVLRWARGQPGTDMSHITIPTHHITSQYIRPG